MANLAFAGTVTWTGTCAGVPVNGSIYFHLANSGNDSAYNVLLTPRLVDATPSNSSYSIGTVSGGGNSTTYIKLANTSGAGTSADYFSLSYSQDGSNFAAVFPCMLTLGGTPTVSQLNITSHTSSSSGKSYINVRIYNPGNATIDANVLIVLPQTFTFISNASVPVIINASSSRNVSFEVQAPGGGSGSYSGAIAANYKLNGLNYGSMHTFLIAETGQSSPGISLVLIVEILVAIAALILLVRIARLAIRKAYGV